MPPISKVVLRTVIGLGVLVVVMLAIGGWMMLRRPLKVDAHFSRFALAHDGCSRRTALGAGKRLNPIALVFFSHGIRSRRQAGYRVVALRVGHGVGLVGVALFVPVPVDVDRPAGQPRLVPVPVALGVQVVELAAADRADDAIEASPEPVSGARVGTPAGVPESVSQGADVAEPRLDRVASEGESAMGETRGCLQTAVAWGLGIALGALAGILPGLLLGIGIAMIVGVL